MHDKRLASLSQHIDEAALLFATEQPEAAISLLEASLSDPPPVTSDAERRAWFMLLELHEAIGQQAGFDRAALAYALRFEASPPQWRALQGAQGGSGARAAQPLTTAPTMQILAPSEATHLLLISDERLDAGAHAKLAQWRQRSLMATALTLDLARVTHVDLAGCQLLLALLAEWQQRGMRLQLQSCESLLALLHGLIQSGRRDDDDAGWRLLIELLRQTGEVERYEDACVAYSLTYEMSPPAAPPPVGDAQCQLSAGTAAATLISAAQDGHPTPANPASGEGAGTVASPAFILPELITLPCELLLSALRTHARQSASGAQALVLDARRLQRIDFHAAGALQAALTELAAGKTVEWQRVSFLVSTLLQLTGGSTLPRIINRMP